MADYLEKIDSKLCVRYLEYIITERQEESTTFHDRLAELYLSMTVLAKKRNDESGHFHSICHTILAYESDSTETRKDAYDKLLKFIGSNDKFGIERLFGFVQPTGIFFYGV